MHRTVRKSMSAGRGRPTGSAALAGVCVLALSVLLTGCATSGSALAPKFSDPLKAALVAEDAGRNLDPSAVTLAADAEYRALETGAAGVPVAWRQSTEVYGTVVPQQPYTVGATNCRRFAHSISVDGKATNVEATACRNDDGVWEPLS